LDTIELELEDDKNMKRQIITLSILSLLIISSYSHAQPSASIYFTTAIPVNDFRYFDNDLGYGGNLEFFFFSPTKEKPFGMGISFSYFGQGLYFYDDPYSDETYLSGNRANNFSSIQLIFQLAPTGGTIKPYLETFFGGSYIFSNSEIYTLAYVPVNLYVDDWAWSYGIGGGFKFLINGDNYNGPLYLDLKGRYLMSSNVGILDRQSIRYANDTFYYSVNETQINFVAVQVGFVFYFR
jgi:hypothetical protein